MNEQINNEIAIDARASAHLYTVFGVIIGMPLLGGLVVFIRSPSNWQGLALMAGASVIFLTWAGRFRLMVRKDVLHYRTLFGGTRSIELADIDKAETKVRAPGASGPMVGLILTPRPLAQVKPIVINMKVFSKQDLNRLFEVLGPRLVGHRRTTVFGKERA